MRGILKRKRKPKLTPEQLERFLQWFLELPQEPVGPCLEYWDILSFIEGEIEDPEELERLENHIQACPKCLDLACSIADDLYGRRGIAKWWHDWKIKRAAKRLRRKLGFELPIWKKLAKLIKKS